MPEAPTSSLPARVSTPLNQTLRKSPGRAAGRHAAGGRMADHVVENLAVRVRRLPLHTNDPGTAAN
jgi:hypothetical protein